jgi:hypothetical protein
MMIFPEEKHLFPEAFPKKIVFFPNKTVKNSLLSKLAEGMLVFSEECVAWVTLVVTPLHC